MHSVSPIQRLSFLLQKEKDEEAKLLLLKMLSAQLGRNLQLPEIAPCLLVLLSVLGEKYIAMVKITLEIIVQILDGLDSVDAIVPGVLAALAKTFLSFPAKVNNQLLILCIQIVEKCFIRLCTHSEGHMIVVLQRTIQLHHHDHAPVRDRVYLMSFNLYNHLHESYPSYAPFLVEAMMLGSMDEFPSTKAKCASSLKSLVLSPPVKRKLQLSFHSHVNGLYKKLMSLNDDKKIESLQLCVGYLTWQGLIDVSEKSISLLIDSLKKYLVFDYKNVAVVAETRKYSEWKSLDEVTVADSVPICRFLYFSDLNIEFWIKRLLNVLGSVPGAFIDDLLEEIDNSWLTCQVLYILDGLVLGWPKFDNTVDTSCWVERILSVVLELPLVNEPCSMKEYQLLCRLNTKQEDVRTISHFNRTILEKTLLVKLVASLCLSQGKSFGPFLFNSLYPVLCGFGDANYVISECSYRSLQTIAFALGNDSPCSLCVEQIDYILNSISLRIRRLGSNPLVLQVLYGLLELLPDDILAPFLSSIVQDLFLALETYKYDTFVQLHVFRVTRKICTKSDSISLTILLKLEHFLSQDHPLLQNIVLDISCAAVECSNDQSQVISWLNRCWNQLLVRDYKYPFILISTLKLIRALIEKISDFFQMSWVEEKLAPIFIYWLKPFKPQSAENDRFTLFKVIESIFQTIHSISQHTDMKRTQLSLLFNLTLNFLRERYSLLPPDQKEIIMNLFHSCFCAWNKKFPDWIWFNTVVRLDVLQVDGVERYRKAYDGFPGALQEIVASWIDKEE